MGASQAGSSDRLCTASYGVRVERDARMPPLLFEVLLGYSFSIIELKFPSHAGIFAAGWNKKNTHHPRWWEFEHKASVEHGRSSSSKSSSSLPIFCLAERERNFFLCL